jgi:LysR family transcriptional regulator for metE and metH
VSLIADTGNRLDARDLEVVLAIASAGSTVKAAAALHLTQSAVSRALLLVEEKLGMPLFERRARGVAPTAAGARLIAGAGGVLAQLAELERQAKQADRGRPLRVVCECYTAYRWLPSTLASLRRGGAGPEVSLAFDHTRAPVAGLLAGEVDVALLTTASVPKTLVERPLFADEIVFIVAATHPLAKQASITPADLRRFPLITSTQTPEPESRWFFSHVFRRTAPRVERLAFPLTEVIVDAARAGMGVAVLSEWIALPYLTAGDLVAKRLRKGPLQRPWRMAYARDTADAANRLASALSGAAPRLYGAGSVTPLRSAG